MGEGKLYLGGGPGLVGNIFLSLCFAFIAKKTGAVDDVVGPVHNFLLGVWIVSGCSVIDCVFDLVNSDLKWLVRVPLLFEPLVVFFKAKLGYSSIRVVQMCEHK